MFALHAGIAIDNARLHEQVQRLAVVEERERIGRDLHDGIIQRIYAVGLSLEDVPELMTEAPDEASARVDRAIDSLNRRSATSATSSSAAAGAARRSRTSSAGLATLAEEFATSSAAEIELDIAVDPTPPRRCPSEPRGPDCSHMAREALSNVVRHSHGRRASRSACAATTTALELAIEDDGDRVRSDSRARGRGHHGLANMRDRAAALGGTLDDRQRSRGAAHRSRIRVPTSAPDQPEEPAA